jgi:hypothetical protein
MKFAVGLAAVAVALLTSCSSPNAGPVATSSASATTPSIEVATSPSQQLQFADGRSALPGKQASAQGYLRLRQTPDGTCAVLSSDLDSWTQLEGFFWPKGYHVVRQGKDARILDAHGRLIAHVGDFLYVRGTEFQESGTLHQRCLHKWGDDLVVKQVSQPGTPFGESRPPVVVVDCQGMPSVEPHSMMLACDGGLSVSRLTFQTWGRSGASGTGIASGACSVSSGFSRVPVRLSLQGASDYHGLLVLGRVHLKYEESNPCA